MSAALLISATTLAWATAFTSTIPGTNDQLPPTYTQAGGVVLVLVGVNGNFYTQMLQPSDMYKGFTHNGRPAAWRGNPTQIAPAGVLDCGPQGCAAYFGGGIAQMHVRFTAYDGDTQAGQFDHNDITLEINGFSVGNWSNVATENTNLAGTVAFSAGQGFGNNTYDTGWFSSNDPGLMANLLNTGVMTPFMRDRDPRDNYWDFTRGNDAVNPGPFAAGWTLDKSTTSTGFTGTNENIVYDYTVKNVGTVAVTAFQLADDKIGNVVCPQATIPVGGQVVCQATYATTQADVDAGKVTNIATVTGTPDVGTLATLTDTVTVNGPAAAPGVELTKSASRPAFATVGQVITYTFSVKNTGNVTLSNLSITDPKIPSLSCSIASLVPMAVDATCTGDYTVTQADVDAGTLSNTATVKGKDPNGTDVEDDGNVTVPGPTAAPALAVTKTPGTTSYDRVGAVIGYTYAVRNTGNVTITNAISVADDKIDGQGGSVSCPALPAGGLAPLASITCSGSYTITQADIDAGSVTNTATASSGSVTSPSATATVNATQNRTLALIKERAASGRTSFDAPNQTLEYRFTLRNTGNTTLTGSATITDSKIGVINCPALPSGGLAPNATHICTASYSTTQADVDAGSVTNTATAAIGTTTSGSDSETIPATQMPKMDLVKSATSVQFTSVGDQVQYSYVIRNTGNVSLSGPFTVTDNFISTVSCPATASLAPNATVTCTGTYSVTQNDLDLGSVTNLASATNGTVTTQQVSETIPANAMPALSITKTATTASFSAVGQTLNYSFEVKNSGNVTLTEDITVVDSKIPNPITCHTGNFVPNATATCTGSYQITQADLDAGSVVNLAYAETVYAVTTPVTSPPDTATVNAGQTPLLEVTKVGDATAVAKAGDAINYTISVKNAGNVTLTNVVVTDPLIPTLSCVIAQLNVNVTDSSCTGAYTATQSDIDAGSVINTASATGNDPSGTPVTDTGGTTTTLPTPTASIDLAKSVAPAAFTKANDILNYTFTVTNTGNVSLRNVAVTDPRIPALSCSVASLAPGAQEVCAASYTVTQLDVDSGDIVNTATVNARSSDPTDRPVSDTASATATGPTLTPAIEIKKRSTVTSFATTSDTIPYVFEVTNTGNVTLNTIAITDPKFPTLACSIATLAPGASDQSCTATAAITQPDIDNGSVTNTATATGRPANAPTTTISDDDTLVIPGPTADPLLELTKSATPTPFGAVNTSITYSFSVKNAGNVTLSNVDVTDPLIPSLSCSIASLAPGVTDTSCSGSYQIKQADVDRGSLTNTATATGTPPQGAAPINTTATVTTAGPTRTPMISLTKTTTDGPYSAVDEEINYSFTIKNTGNVTLSGAFAVADDKIDAQGGSVTCPTGGSLAPMAELICTGTYKITQADLDAGSVVNNATASNANTPDATAQFTVNASQNPQLQLVKEIRPGTPTAFDDDGVTLQYVYTLRNTGNVTLTGTVSVTDNKIASVSCPALPPAGLAPMATHTCTASYVTTQGDVDSGGVTNTATATIGTTTSNNDSATATAVQKPELSVQKTVTAPVGALTLGLSIGYQYVVKNEGNTTITAPISVADDKIDGAGGSVSCPALPPAGLAPGSAITCVGSYSVVQNDINLGSITNTASATDGTVTSPQVSVTVGASNPALQITKSTTTASYDDTTDTISYSYRVVNTGLTTLTGGVQVIDDKIAGPIQCHTGNFAPNAVATCTATYTVNQNDLNNGSVTNQAYARSEFAGVPVTSNTDTVTVNAVQNPELEVTKAALPTSFTQAGNQLAYTISVKNIGNVRVDNITISDPLFPALSCTITSLDPTVTDSTCTATYTVTQDDVNLGKRDNTATARGSAPNGSPVTATGNLSTPGPAAAPVVEIEKTSDIATVDAIGQDITYTFTVRNRGNVTLTGITVSDPLIPALSCSIPDLNPTESDASCTGVYRTKQTDYDRGFVDNRAEVRAVSADPTGQTVRDDDTNRVNGGTREPGLTIKKNALTASYDDENDEIDYEFIVSNTGNVTLTQPITVTDSLITGQGGTITCDPLPAGGLAPLQAIRCTATYEVDQPDVDRGFVSNTAGASTTYTDPISGVTTNVNADPNSERVDATQSPAIELIKSATLNDGGDGRADKDDTITYAFTVRNTGNVTISNITITDPKVTVSGSPITLAPNTADTTTFTASYTLTQADINAGSFTNTATVNGRLPDGSSISDVSDTDDTTQTGDDDPTVTNLPRQPLIELIKSSTLNDGGDGRADKDDTISFTFTVRNTGNVTLTNVIVADAGISLSGGPIAELLPGASDTTTFTGTYRLKQSDVDLGRHTNTATVTAKDPTGTDVTDQSDSGNVAGGGPNDPTITTLNASPSIELIKAGALDAGANGRADKDDEITYTFIVRNTGNVTLSNITVTDPGITVTGGPIPSLAPGASDSTTITGTHKIDQIDIDQGAHNNRATVMGTPPTGPPVNDVSDSANPADGPNDDDRTVVPLTRIPGIELTKTATPNFGSDSRADAGDTIDYVLEVRNTGNVTLTNVTLADPKITLNTTVIGTLLPGASASATGAYTIKQSDIDAGSVTNTATVTSRDPQNNPVGDVSDSGNPADGSGPDDPTTTVLPPASSIALTKTAAPTAYTKPNDTITFRFAVKNTGNTTISAITVTDPFFPTFSCSISAILPGDTDSSCSITYQVQQADVDRGQINNTARVDGTVPGGTVSATDSVTVNGPAAAPALSIEKATTAVSYSAVNEVITYTFKVKNEGNVTLSQPFTVADDKIDGAGGSVVCPTTPASLAPTQELTCTGDYTITQADIDSQSVTNIASAKSGSTMSPTDSVTLGIARATLSGTVFEDTNGNGLFDGGDQTKAGFIVEISRGGSVVQTTTTNGSGFYEFTNLLPGDDYTVTFRDPSSLAVAGGIGPLTLSPGANVTDQDLPIDPSGVIYNSQTRQPVAGVRVTMTDASGTPLPNACFVSASQQNQVTGANGAYRFDIVPGAAAACPASQTEYQIVLEEPSGFSPLVSSIIPPTPGPLDATTCSGDAVPGGSCQPVASTTAPPTGNPDTYYLAFLLEPGDPDVVNNHIPIDPITALRPVTLTKTSPIRDIRVGQVIPYTITARNEQAFEITPFTIIDTPPVGLRFKPGTATVNGTAVTPVLSGRSISFNNLTLPANGELTVTLQLAVAANAELGRYTNRAEALDSAGIPLSEVASATVELRVDPVFDCSLLIGRVFDDRNRDGYHSPGEPGLPGVRIATAKGLLTTTDKHGRYHIACAAVPDRRIGSNFIAKVDVRTLPTGYRMTSENPRVVRLTRGKAVKMNFGASITRVVRLDLKADAFIAGDAALSRRWQSGLNRLFDTLQSEQSVLRLTYHGHSGERRLARNRLHWVKRRIERIWRRRRGGYPLSIETRMVGGVR